MTDAGSELLRRGLRRGDKIIKLNEKVVVENDLGGDDQWLVSWFNDIPATMDDEITLIVDRDEEKKEIVAKCIESRKKFADTWQPIVTAISKDKPKVCLDHLDKLSFDVTDSRSDRQREHTNACSRRAITKGKITQSDYNYRSYKLDVSLLNRNEYCFSLEGCPRMTSAEYLEGADEWIIMSENFLARYGDNRLADRLVERYEKHKKVLGAPDLFLN